MIIKSRISPNRFNELELVVWTVLIAWSNSNSCMLLVNVRATNEYYFSVSINIVVIIVIIMLIVNEILRHRSV